VPVGDYVLSYRVVIERKIGDGLAESIHSLVIEISMRSFARGVGALVPILLLGPGSLGLGRPPNRSFCTPDRCASMIR
jgi:hypothetical protein